MNLLLIGIDSLRRDVLGAYEHSFGMDVQTPNLDRFAERAAVFDNHYAGSLPCMPARREWLTGTQEFLWRPWGPIEPFDDTIPDLLRQNGVLSKLITDHYHYFQHGSHGYYEGFNGFDFLRGHEYDAHQTSPKQPGRRLLDQTADTKTDGPESLHDLNRVQYARNVDDLDEREEEQFFAPRLFSRAAEWLRENREWDQWFCFVDSFDVHEPFHVPEPYASMYTDEDPRDPDLTVWPYYGQTDAGQSELTDREEAFIRSQFAGKVTMTDRWFGNVLDALDRLNGWEETMVVVTSDHGFLLGEHGWMGKNHPPVYNVLANTPLFIWDPESPRMGEHIGALTSAVDLYSTILDALGVGDGQRVHSQSLLPLLKGDTQIHRETALFGYWGTAVNITDGQYTYLHPSRPERPSYCFSTSMMNPDSFFTPPEPETEAESVPGLPYADTPVWKFPGTTDSQLGERGLYDVTEDWYQTDNLAPGEPETVAAFQELLGSVLTEYDAPATLYERLGLEAE
jgi:arylsulfatase A-like enzyme